MLLSQTEITPEDRAIYAARAPYRKYSCPSCSAVRSAFQVEAYRRWEALCDWQGSEVWFAMRRFATRGYRNTPAATLALLDGPFEISPQEAFDLDLRPE